MHASDADMGWRAALTILARYVLLGPAIGGAPYLWAVIGIPFAYALGAGPALVGGVLMLWWLRLGGRSAALPGPWHAAAFGALFGAIGAVAAQIVIVMLTTKSFDFFAAVADALYGSERVWAQLIFILPHAVVAGAIMAAWTVKRLGTVRPKPAPQLPAALDDERLAAV
jgi:hypothetical protein